MTALPSLDELREAMWPTPNPYAEDPVGWVQEQTRDHLWSKQREILESVQANRKTAVKACHGPGKSWTAARVVGWLGSIHPAGSVSIVTSAPTSQQVSKILWKELRRLHTKAGLDGRIVGSTGLDEWKVGAEVLAFGRKPADHDANGFQGIHDDKVVVVLDEACGIPAALWTATDTLVTNESGRILAIGNPDHPLSEFATICDGAPEDGTSGWSKDGWWVITISIFDTPNFTDEVVPPEVASRLPSKVWLEERRHKWGVGSPLWTSKVLGQFPIDAAAGVVPWSWLKRCQGEEATERIGPLRVPIELGIDVAGSEQGDKTIVQERCGSQAGRVWEVQSADPEVVLQLIELAVRESGPSRVKVDAIGVGWGLMAPIRRTFPSLDVAPVVVSESAPGEDSARFVNLRSFMWWEVGRRLSQDGAWDLTGVDDETLNDMAAPKYREVNGRIQVESKDDIRKRIGRSTDKGDALLLAFLDPPRAMPLATAQEYQDAALDGSR